MKNNFCLILNAHLPFVKHPEYSSFFEEDWFFEALTESYVPILNVFSRLKEDKVPFKVVLSVSQTLLAMLEDEFLISRYIKYLKKMVELSCKEVERTKNDPEISLLSKMYLEKYEKAYNDFVVVYKKDILNRVKDFIASGNFEIITTSATHAFLPLYESYPNIVDSQIKIALDNYRQNFGVKPDGFWLSDLGYYPGLDKILKKNGVKYFFSSANGLMLGEKNPKYGLYSSYKTENGVNFLCRDIFSTDEILNSEKGYPSNAVYRDFNRDIGFDLPFDEIKEFLLDKKHRIHTGIKYYAITGAYDKNIYNRKVAEEQAKKDAKEFVKKRETQFKNISKKMDGDPIIVAPFDAQMFGHFWFEGPIWLEYLFRYAAESKSFEFVKPSEYIDSNKNCETLEPIFSSYATGGFAQQFLEGSNDWIYINIFSMIEKMFELSKRYYDEKGLKERILNQAFRELLLCQASDWPFIMRLYSNSGYAISRVSGHIENFNKLCDSLISDTMDTEWFLKLEKKNSVFPKISYKELNHGH